jgi:ribonuclease HI
MELLQAVNKYMGKSDNLNDFVDDTGKIKKILKLLDRLRGGDTLVAAAGDADVTRKELDRLLDAIESELQARLPKKPKPPVKRKPGSLRHATLYSDGASRGNPGKAACSVVVYDEQGDEILARTEILGVATNNVAEYRGVLLGLQLARDLAVPSIDLRLDSELVVKQLQGLYKVKHPALQPLYEQARVLLSGFISVSIEHIPRKKNMRADELANAALDGKD